MAVVLVLRDRYLTLSRRSEWQVKKLAIPLLLLTVPSYALAVLVFALSTVYAASGGAALIYAEKIFSPGSFVPHYYTDLRNFSTDVYYVYVAFYIAATLFLLGFAVMIRKVGKTDKITSLTLVGIMPFLVLRALARLIFVIFQASLTDSQQFNFEDINDTGFARALVEGVLYVTVMGVLVYFLMHPQLWDAKGGHVMLKDVSTNSHRQSPIHAQFPYLPGANYSSSQGAQEPPSPHAWASFDDKKTSDGI